MIKQDLFRIKGVGIDTSTIKEPTPSGILNNVGYVITDLGANNDYLLSGLINSLPSNTPLVVMTDFIDHVEEAINGHLGVLGRDAVDLLLVDPGVNWDVAKGEIKALKDIEKVKNFGVINPESEQVVKDIEAAMGEKVSYIALNISPIEFNYDLVQWAQANDVTVFGFNPFSGYLSAARSIESFTAPYLLGFSATWSDVVVLSGRDLYKSWKSAEYLQSLVGKESSPKYVIKKNISRLIKPLKKIVGTAAIVTPTITIPYDDPEVIVDVDGIDVSLGESRSNIPPLENEKDDELCVEVNEYIRTMFFPEDAKPRDIIAIARYKIAKYLSIPFSAKDGWKINFAGLGDTVLAISVHREGRETGALFWKKKIEAEIHRFILLVPKGREGIMFLREKNTEE